MNDRYDVYKWIGIAILFALLSLFTGNANAATQMVDPFTQWEDANGDPCNGCLIFTYTTGTTTKKVTYTDAAEGTPNANPVVLGSDGRANIWLEDDSQYRMVLAPSTDSDPPVAPIKTVDNVDTLFSVAVFNSSIFTVGHTVAGVHLGYRLLSEFTSLSNAVATIGATETELWIDDDDTLTGTVTCPATMSVTILKGYTITLGAFDLELDGPFKAEPFPVFNQNSTGVVVYGSRVKAILPDWYTANTTPKTTDMTTAVRAAATAGIVNNIPVEINSMMLLTAAVNVDRATDGAAFDEYFEIYSHNHGGFYLASDGDMFSSAVAYNEAGAGTPVTQLVKFNGIYFESSAAGARYVLDDGRYLRTLFNNCSFSKIRCLTSPNTYTQSIYFQNCNMRRWTGTFFDSQNISYDIRFSGCMAEAGGADVFAYLGNPRGCAFVNTLMEGHADSAIKYFAAGGLAIHGCYFEGNGDDAGYEIEAISSVDTSYGVSILGNLISHIASGSYTPFNEEAIHWELCLAGESKGNYFVGRGHDLKSTGYTVNSQVEINDWSSLADVTMNGVLSGTGAANPMFMVQPASAQENIASGSNITVVFGTERYDRNGDFAANTFTAPRTGRYHFDVHVRLLNLDGAADYYDAYLITDFATYPVRAETEHTVDSGTTDSTTADMLEDAGQNFSTTVTVGDNVYNMTDNTIASVTVVDDNDTLSLSSDIMVSGEAYIITASQDRPTYPFTLGVDCQMQAGHTAYVAVKQASGSAQTDIDTSSWFSGRYIGY